VKTTTKTSARNSTLYIVRLGNSQAEVIVPPRFPSPDPDQELVLAIGRQVKIGELPSATITIDGEVYAARLVRDHSLDAN
jgi:hypothetical protein